MYICICKTIWHGHVFALGGRATKHPYHQKRSPGEAPILTRHRSTTAVENNKQQQISTDINRHLKKKNLI